MVTVLRNGLITLALAVSVVVALVSIPRGGDVDYPTWTQRAVSIAQHVATARLPEPSKLTRTTALFSGLPRRIGQTALLVFGAMFVALAIALPVGVASAQEQGRSVARQIGRVLTGLSSLPVIVWATVLLLLSLRFQVSFTGRPSTALLAAIVALVLGDRLVGDLIGRVSAVTRDLLAEPHMRTVRAAGFSVFRHLVQGLVPPVADAVASRTLFLVGGAIVAESLFSVQGLGTLVLKALNENPLERELVVVCAIGLVLLGTIVRALAEGAALLADGRRRG